MIITRQWIQEYIDISKLSTDTICKALNSIGLEVDSVERVLIPNGVVIGKVTSKQKHPDADKLNICQVDVGSKSVQIVCGAKNVDVEQIVPVAMVGSVLGKDFTIKEAVLRGVDSHGMICSSTEIGLPEFNDGILVLDDSIGKLTIGKELNEYPLINDEIIEIELTANRGDCLSINGVARELSTYFNIPLNNNDKVLKTNNKGIGQVFEVDYDTSCESNLIYKASDITNFDLKLVQQLRASTIDKLRSTDIETAIAYITHCTGVLINVYTKSIATQHDNKMVSLTIKKDENGFDTVSGQLLLSTIGIESGHISDISDEVIIEASYTKPEQLAQRVFEKKQKTGDIYYKASRGSEPNLSFGIDAMMTLLSLNGATIYNGSADFIDEVKNSTLIVNVDRINKIIGQEIEENKITKILSSLGFDVKTHDNDTIAVVIPSFRHDIKNIADITEEIVRIIGIDNIVSKPLELREQNSINETSNNLILKNAIRQKAISNNFYETITYVFSNKELLEKYKFDVVSKDKDILNPIVNELNTFRTTIALNLVQAVSSNVKHGLKSIGFFEIGTIFNAQREESKSLSFIFSGEKESQSIDNHGKPELIDLFSFSQKISNVIGDFELVPLTQINNDFIHPYQNANIIKDGEVVGMLYKLHPTVASDFDISNDTYIADIDFDKLSSDIVLATSISKFQSSKRDLSIITPKSLEYSKIKAVINSLKIKEITQFNLIDIYSDDTLGDDESLTIKFILQSDKKTMEESDITSIMDKILETLQKELQIGIR